MVSPLEIQNVFGQVRPRIFATCFAILVALFWDRLNLIDDGWLRGANLETFPYNILPSLRKLKAASSSRRGAIICFDHCLTDLPAYHVRIAIRLISFRN
jgi:hypothetical protein